MGLDHHREFFTLFFIKAWKLPLLPNWAFFWNTLVFIKLYIPCKGGFNEILLFGRPVITLFLGFRDAWNRLKTWADFTDIEDRVGQFPFNTIANQDFKYDLDQETLFRMFPVWSKLLQNHFIKTTAQCYQEWHYSQNNTWFFWNGQGLQQHYNS